MSEVAYHLIAYSQWASRRLVRFLGVPHSQNFQALQLMNDLLSEEQKWLISLTPGDRSTIKPRGSSLASQCEALINENFRRYEVLVSQPSENLSRSPDQAPSVPVESDIPVHDLIIQAVSNAAYGRGRVVAAIGTNGQTPPKTDYLTFLREVQGQGSILLSVVVPVYNEAAVLPSVFKALQDVLDKIDCSYELIFVDDGSEDASSTILSQAALSDPRIKVLVFSRNFGHQAAITAGLDFASGDAVVVMDADLQDPPEILPDMVRLFRQGYDIVSAQRISREGDGIFKRATAAIFYKVMRSAFDRLVPEVGDFRLYSRASIVALRTLREQHRFIRGMAAWMGLKEAVIPFHRQPRAAGETKYPTWKMMRFAWTAISSFSGLPLRLTLLLGLALTGVGFVYLIYVVYAALVLKITSPGWASLVALQVTFSGAMLVAIGLVGDYIARIYEESKRRPLYILVRTVNASPSTNPDRAIVLPLRRSSSTPKGEEELDDAAVHRHAI